MALRYFLSVVHVAVAVLALIDSTRLVFGNTHERAEQRIRRLLGGVLIYVIFVGATGMLACLLGSSRRFSLVAAVVIDDFKRIVLVALPVSAAICAGAAPSGPSCRWFLPDLASPKRRIAWRDVGATIGWALLVYGCAEISLSWVQAEIGPVAKQLLELGKENPLLVLWLALRGAAAEEFFYRGFLFCWCVTRLKRFASPRLAWTLAAFGSSLIFALEHGGYLVPPWFKISQAFALGLTACFITWRYGLEMAILFHGAFNSLVLMEISFGALLEH